MRVLVLAGMAVAVGTGAVGGAWVLLRLIALVTNLAYYGAFSFVSRSPGVQALHWWAVLVPVAGGLVIGLMARFGSQKIRGHGIPEAIEAILIGGSRMDLRVAVLKPISSALSIGTGGPFGAEGPIIVTGGAIGSLFAQCFEMTAAERKVLLVAGAAAGMTAIFGTPVAAVLLAVELLLFEWKPRSFIPVVVACVTAAIERGLLLAPVPLFPAPALAAAGAVTADVAHAAGWLALGILCGFGSGILTAMVYGTEDAFAHLRLHWMWWPAIGGLVVGLGGLVDPAALGVGYANIAHLMTGTVAGRAVLLLLVVKAVIWAVALGSGTSGGVLAPLLMLGGAVGALASPYLPPAPPGFWALLGMAAMMAGAMRAPLTAALFAVELTGELGAILPLLAACAASYAVTVLLLKRSILTEKVARRGRHIRHEYQVDPYALVAVQDVMATDVETLDATIPAAEAAAFFTGPGPRHKAYPVVDRDGRLVGMISRADALAWLRTPPGGLLGEAVGRVPATVAHPDEPVADVIERMVQDDAGRVPVVTRGDGRVVGLLARKDILRVRGRLAVDESLRERVARPPRITAPSHAAAETTVPAGGGPS